MWNQWNVFFKKMTEERNFHQFRGAKWPDNQTHKTHIQYTSKSSSNDYVNQDWCEAVETS